MDRRGWYAVITLSVIVALAVGCWLGVNVNKLFDISGGPIASKPQPPTTYQAGTLGTYEIQLSYPQEMAENGAAAIVLMFKNDTITAPGLLVESTVAQTDNCSSIPIDLQRQAMPAPGQSEVFGWAISTRKPGQCIFSIANAVGFAKPPPHSGNYLRFTAARVNIKPATDLAGIMQPYITALLAAVIGVLTARYTRPSS